MTMKIGILFLLTLIISCSTAEQKNPTISHRNLASSEKGDPEDYPRPGPWPATAWRTIVEAADDVGYSLTQVLFDNIDQFDQSIYDHDRVRLKAKIKREVFDNQDVLNSYSVVDKFYLNVDAKNLAVETPLFTPNLVLGFGFGIGGVMEWTNIRQVTASRYTQIPSVSQEQNDLEFRDHTGGDVTVIDTYGRGNLLDPSFRPRLARYWNLVTFPFKLPVNLKKLAKMEEGELISYSVSGYVEMGPNIGFTTMPYNLPGRVELSAYYRVFIKGNYKITILKENDRFVRVKVTREREKGSRWGLGGGAMNYELYDGFLLFEGKDLETRLLATKASLVPFQFKVEKKYINAFDVGYRYDLKYEESREAFKKAVFGSFARTMELQDRTDPTTNDKIVEKLFTKSSFGTNINVNHRFDLRFFTKKVGKDNQSVEASIKLPSGEHLVFKESKKMTNEWKLIWGRFERLNYNYTIALDKTSYLEGKPDALQLIVEAGIEDSHTTGYEMQKYTRLIRQALGQDDLLPDLPTYLPLHERIVYNDGTEEINDLPRMKKAKYRKSHFYYGFNITQKQLERFMKTPVEKMWAILEKAFGIKEGQWSTPYRRAKYRAAHILPSLANVPLFLANVHLRKGGDLEAANSIYIRWKELSEMLAKSSDTQLHLDIDKKVKLLSEVFSSKYYGHEHLKMILNALDNEDLDYFLVATNDAFGRIQQRGRVTTNSEYLLNLTDENIGFERLAGGFKSNPDILVSNLVAETLEDGSVKFGFDLDHVPEILYFKLFKTNRLQKFTILSELAFKNKGRFVKGHNELIISHTALGELEYLLGSPLILNNFYSLTISSTKDGYSWSKVATQRFHYVLPIPNEPVVEEELDKESRKALREKHKEEKRQQKFKEEEATLEDDAEDEPVTE